MRNTIRCKFKCVSVEKAASWNKGMGGFLYTAKFEPVTSGSAENDSFFAHTPCGGMTIGQYEEDAFIPGNEYFIDISIAAAIPVGA